MGERISKLANAVRPSETMAIDAKAKELTRKGFDVISFAIGEPDFPTPLNIKQATIAAVNGNFTKYSPASGVLDLRQAIANKLKKENGLDYPPEDIIVSNGAKHSLFNAFLATINPGDEVIVFAPYWVSYVEQIRMCGGNPVVVQTQADFEISIDNLEKAISKKTKLIILNSPNNPTGKVYSEKTLGEVARVAVENDLLVISDEIYEKIIFGKAVHKSIASFNREIMGRTITINGVSKSFAMTGYRVGYAAGLKEVISAMSRIQSQTTSGINSMAQKAALEALSGGQSEVKKMVATFEKRKGLVCSELEKIDGIQLSRPQGTFYVFPNVSKLFSKRNGSTSAEFCDKILELAKVALVSGSAFGSDGFVRISFALPEEKLIEGIARLKGFLT